MGSRVMHYCIASIISKHLGLSNESEFILGGIAPDIHPFMDIYKPKDITHFVDRDENGKGHINYLRYYNKYKQLLYEPFYLGYLCHLISDVVWSEFYFNIIEHKSIEEKKETLQISYRDFWRLNGRLIKRYSLENHRLSLSKPIKITEVNLELYLPDLLDWIKKDFSYDEKVANEPLELFNDDSGQIIDYIEKSVNKCMHFISQMHGFPFVEQAKIHE